MHKIEKALIPGSWISEIHPCHYYYNKLAIANNKKRGGHTVTRKGKIAEFYKIEGPDVANWIRAEPSDVERCETCSSSKIFNSSLSPHLTSPHLTSLASPLIQKDIERRLRVAHGDVELTSTRIKTSSKSEMSLLSDIKTRSRIDEAYF